MTLHKVVFFLNLPQYIIVFDDVHVPFMPDVEMLQFPTRVGMWPVDCINSQNIWHPPLKKTQYTLRTDSLMEISKFRLSVKFLIVLETIKYLFALRDYLRDIRRVTRFPLFFLLRSSICLVLIEHQIWRIVIGDFRMQKICDGKLLSNDCVYLTNY